MHSLRTSISKEKGVPDYVQTDVVAVHDLEQLGYKQELVRSRGLFHILFMTLAIMAVPYGLSAPIATSLIGGGPATIIWGWLFVSVIVLPLAFSLAEISSKYPTSAGAYYWTYRLASPKTRLVLSWINGWLNLVGVWTISLSVTFGTAQLIVAGVGIFRPEWVAAPWQTYLIFVGVTVISGIIVVFCNHLLPMIDILSACWMVLGIIIILVGFSAKAAAGRRPASFALGHFDPSASGWNPGWTFFIGLLPPAYTYSAIGMITSMAEEVHEPTTQVPRAIVYSIPIGFLSGMVFLLPIMFTLPDIETLLAVPGGQPVGVMFTLIMGSRSGGFGMWFIIFGIGMFCAISICCAASRTTWSFARDGAIPFHAIFARVATSSSTSTSTSTAVPLNAHLLSTAVQLLLGLIYLGSSAAFNAFVGVAVICLSASYAMPIALSLAGGRSEMGDAPYKLGRWGGPLNAWAVAWVIFEIVLFSMPAVVPVTQVTMNYASVVFVGFGVISGAWYLIDGRHHYAGPPIPEDPNHSEKDAGSLETVSP